MSTALASARKPTVSKASTAAQTTSGLPGCSPSTKSLKTSSSALLKLPGSAELCSTTTTITSIAGTNAETDGQNQLSSAAAASQADKSVEELIPIYTDWANHYLEKAHKQRLIQDLQRDLQDSLLLVDVIEAVINQKIPGVKQKSKGANQNLENINACLSFLESADVSVEGFTAKGIKECQLKEILGLFFSLSRYKQQQKANNSATASPAKHSTNQNSAVVETPASATKHTTAPVTTTEMLKPPSATKVPSVLPTAVGQSASGLPHVTPKRHLSNGTTGLKSKESGIATPKSSKHTSSNLPVDSSPSNTRKFSSTSGGTPTPCTPQTVATRSLLPSEPYPPGSSSRVPNVAATHELKQPSKLSAPKINSSNAIGGSSKQSTNQNLASLSKPSNPGGPSKSIPASRDFNSQTTMLEKFRLFGSGSGSSTKQQQQQINSGLLVPSSPRVSKSSTRASNSSSGFSSSKSEFSDGYDSYVPPGAGLMGGELAASSNPPNNPNTAQPQSEPIRMLGSPKAALKAAFSKKKSPKLPRRAGNGADTVMEPVMSFGKVSTAGGTQTAPTAHAGFQSVGKQLSRGTTTAAVGSLDPRTIGDLRTLGDPRTLRDPRTLCDPRTLGDLRGQRTGTGVDCNLRSSSKESDRSEDADSAYAGCDSSPSSSTSATNYFATPVSSSSGVYQKPISTTSASTATPTSLTSSSGSSTSAIQSPSSSIAKVIPKPMLAVKGTKQSSSTCQSGSGSTTQTGSGQTEVSRAQSLQPSEPGGSNGQGRIRQVLSGPIATSTPIKNSQTGCQTNQSGYSFPKPCSLSVQSASAVDQVVSQCALSSGEQQPIKTVYGNFSKVPPPPSQTVTALLEQYKSGTSSRCYTGTATSTTANQKKPSGIGSGTAVVGVVSPISQRQTKFQPAASGDTQSNFYGDENQSEQLSGRGQQGALSSVSKPTFFAKPVSTATTDNLNASFDSLNGGGSGGHQSDSNSSQSGNQSDSTSVIYRPPQSVNGRSLGGKRSASEEPVSVAVARLDSSTSSKTCSRRSLGRLETTFDCGDGIETHTLPGSKETSLLKDSPMTEEELDDAIKPMKPLAPPSAYLRSLSTMNAKVASSLHGSNLKLTPEFVQLASNGRKPHLALSSRPTGSNYGAMQVLVSDGNGFSKQITSGSRLHQPARIGDDVTVGYASDGGGCGGSGVLAPPRFVAPELEVTGYMSEAGVSLYARRLQARFREGMELVRDSLKKPTDVIDDSYEDSSSVSSGISETVDEISTDDLTGSSLSDQALNLNSTNHIAPKRHVTKQQGPLSNQNGFGHQLTNSHQNQRQGSARVAATDFNPQSIDTLLQKCRTSARGMGSNGVSEPHFTQFQNGSAMRPKSDQYNPGGSIMSTKPFPSERELLTTMQNGCEPKYRGHNQGTRTTGTTSSVADISRGGRIGAGAPQCLAAGEELYMEYCQRPASAAAHHHNDRGAIMTHGSSMVPAGYHSLDRKKHFYPHGSIMDCGGSNASQPPQDPKPSTGAGSSLVLFSPGSNRRQAQPGFSLPMGANLVDGIGPSNGGPVDAWMRHSVGGSSMSRSLIEPQSTAENGGSLKLSRMSENGGTASASSKESGRHQRLSVPSSTLLQQQQLAACNVALNGVSSQLTFDMLNEAAVRGGSSRLNGTGTTRGPAPGSEGNFGAHPESTRHSGSEYGSPTSQLQLHNLTSSAMSTRSEPVGNGHRAASCGPVVPSPFGPASSAYLNTVLGKINVAEDEGRGSTLSLASSTSGSVYSTVEEKCQMEMKRLHREVESYKEKVQMLTNQQCTYAHVVSAFEQSLNSMKNRIMALTATSVQKDQEIQDLTDKFEMLRQVSASAGIPLDHVFSPRIERRHTYNSNGELDGNVLLRQASLESVNSVQSEASQRSGVSTNTSGSGGRSKDGKDPKQPTDKKLDSKRTWLRSSLKAFTRKGKKPCKNGGGSTSDADDTPCATKSTPCTPQHTPRHCSPKTASSTCALNEDDDPVVGELQKQLQEKDSALTDIRLEAMTTAQQMDQLKDYINKLKSENAHLRQHNELLKAAAVGGSSRAASQCSGGADEVDDSGSSSANLLSEFAVPSLSDTTAASTKTSEVRVIKISVCLGFHGDIDRLNEQSAECDSVLIGTIGVSHNTQLETVDKLIAKLFKSYVLRIDPEANLGLSADSLLGYHFGSRSRVFDTESGTGSHCSVGADHSHFNSFLSENAGTTPTIRVALKGIRQSSIDALSFTTLVPKPQIQRYLTPLLEHRRIILNGPCGTGKSFLAQKLSEYLVLRNHKELTPNSVATLSLDNSRSSPDLKQYLATISRHCENSENADAHVDSDAELPTALVLDNVQSVRSLSEVFQGFPTGGGGSRHPSSPYIIVTMNQSTGSTMNLQLHHNFRIILLQNHADPVKGFLGRYLRRRFVDGETRVGRRYPSELQKIIDWLPKVWNHLNKFIETVSSSDVTIGPRLFLSCPLDVLASKDWFIELWNQSIVPYLLEAGREGLQLYGKRLSLYDPTDLVLGSWPWSVSETAGENLLRVRLEDLGSDAMSSKRNSNSTTQDPLLSLLVRLHQSTVKLPEGQEDAVSVDSNIRLQQKSF